MRLLVAGFATLWLLIVPVFGRVPSRHRQAWLALAKSGFVLAEGQKAVDVLIEASVLLASPDPVRNPEPAYWSFCCKVR